VELHSLGAAQKRQWHVPLRPMKRKAEREHEPQRPGTLDAMRTAPSAKKKVLVLDVII
jgi:hypothetical protein